MTVKLGTEDGYVAIEQTNLFDESDKFRAEEARVIANDLLNLADEVDNE